MSARPTGDQSGRYSDHLMTAEAALDAAGNLACARRLHFVDYASSRLPENLDPKQRDMRERSLCGDRRRIRALDHSAHGIITTTAMSAGITPGGRGRRSVRRAER
jgi:hypothetical protein